MARSVDQNHIALAFPSLTVGSGCVVADKGLSVGLLKPILGPIVLAQALFMASPLKLAAGP